MISMHHKLVTLSIYFCSYTLSDRLNSHQRYNRFGFRHPKQCIRITTVIGKLHTTIDFNMFVRCHLDRVSCWHSVLHHFIRISNSSINGNATNHDTTGSANDIVYGQISGSYACAPFRCARCQWDNAKLELSNLHVHGFHNKISIHDIIHELYVQCPIAGKTTS